MRTLLCFFLLLSLSFHVACSSRNSSEVCISTVNRYPHFLIEGKPPGALGKYHKLLRPLSRCDLFRENTCCDFLQTSAIHNYVASLATHGEADEECVKNWELLECSICDPRIGVKPGPPLICSSLCDVVMEACSRAFFSINPRTNFLVPCGSVDDNYFCGRASEWASNGTELCQLAGFSVYHTRDNDKDYENPYCFGRKMSQLSTMVLGIPYGVECAYRRSAWKFLSPACFEILTTFTLDNVHFDRSWTKARKEAYLGMLNGILPRVRYIGDKFELVERTEVIF